MWKGLKELLFGKKSLERTMPKQAGGLPKIDEGVVKEIKVEEDVIRKELPFIEEVKMIFGDYAKLFTTDIMKDIYGNDVCCIVADYVDDEGMKELVIMEDINNKDIVLVTLKEVMKAGTFNVSDMLTIKREVEQQIPNVSLDYYVTNYSMNASIGLYRDTTMDEADYALMMMNIIWGLEAHLKQVMPAIRLQYGRK